MTAVGRCLPAVGQLSADDVHLIVIGAAHHVGRELQQCGGGREETPSSRCGCRGARNASCTSLPELTVAAEERRDNSRKLDGCIGTIFVGVHALGSAVSGPFVGSVEVDVKFLAPVESVAFGETYFHLWSHASDGALHEVGLHIEIVRPLKHAVH